MISSAVISQLINLLSYTPSSSASVEINCVTQNERACRKIQGALIVTTPQSAALQVTKRGVNMFEKLKVPVIGMVENMSHAICHNCGAKNFVFGKETKRCAEQMGLEIIESFEVDQNMSECINSGKPAIYALPDSIHAEKYRQLANKVFKYIETKESERAKFKE